MKSLPYAADRNDLRQSCLKTALLFDKQVKASRDANHAEYIAALAASSYAYNLAAAIQWVAKNVNEDAADELAIWLDSSLTNGDFDEMNGDLIDCAPNEIDLSHMDGSAS